MTPLWKWNRLFLTLKLQQHLCNGKIVAESRLWPGSSQIFYLERSLLTFRSVVCPTTLDVCKKHGKDASSGDMTRGLYSRKYRHCTMFCNWCHSFLSCNLSIYLWGKGCSWWQDGFSLTVAAREQWSLWACLLNQEVMRERRLSRSHTTYLTLLITSRLCDINEEAFRLGGNYDHRDILRLTYKWISLHQETIEPRYHGIDSYINKLRNILATH